MLLQSLTPYTAFVLITLLAGGLILSNFYDLMDTTQAGNYTTSIRQFINLVGLIALVWLHYFGPQYIGLPSK